MRETYEFFHIHCNNDDGIGAESFGNLQHVNVTNKQNSLTLFGLLGFQRLWFNIRQIRFFVLFFPVSRG